MADEFDPYYTWLGIPPEHQPADHYRLLGLRQFEDHGDVISNALDQKMQFLRTMQVGKRSAVSQKVLNEISAAGGVLLDPKKKQAYDAELKGKEAAKKAPAQLPAAKPLPKTAVPLPTSPAAARPAPARPVLAPPAGPAIELSLSPKSAPPGDAAPRPGASWMVPAIAVGGVLSLLVIGLVLWSASRMFGPNGKKVASNPTKHIAVTPDRNAVKPGPAGTPGEIKTTLKTSPTVIPEVNPETPKIPVTPDPTKPAIGPSVPVSSGQGWWKERGHVERLVALQFGTDAYAEFPDSASRSTLATPLTAEMWLRLQLQGDQPARILGTILGGEGAVPKGWGLIVRRVQDQGKVRGQLYVEIWKPNNEYVHYPVTLVDDGTWHHIAVVLEPERPGKVFVDGQSKEFAVVKDVTSSQRNLVLGSETQPSGASFKAEVCGMRVSQSVRYGAAFSPPSPLDMNPDEATFAAVDSRLYQPTAATPDKPYPWLYGTGKFDPQTKKIVNFKPLRFGTDRQWQGGKNRPDNKLDWIALDPFGGCPGKSADQLAVRRWVAPADGEVSVTGHLRHFHSWRSGDGVRARIVSSSTGTVGEWRVLFQDIDTPARGLKVQAGDTIDFAVDCEKNSDCDVFDWIVDLKLVDTRQQVVGIWNSARDFRIQPTTAQAPSNLREPARSKAQWVPLENFAIILQPFREGPGSMAQLVAQYMPPTPAKTPTPLVLKPSPTKPTPLDNQVPFEAPLAPKRSPVPDAAALAKAKTEVLQVFGDDLKNAKASKQKQELAQKMLDLVRDTADGATKYALLEEVRRLAIEGHDTSLAASAIEKLGEHFEVDLLPKKIKLFEAIAAEGLTPAQRGEAISSVCEMGYEALDADQFEHLPAIVAIARSMAVKAAPAEAKVEAKEFFDAYSKKQKLIEAIKRAEQAIAGAPNEPGANLTLGLYHVFSRGNEMKGLPLLAKGSDQKLAAAAKLREQNLAKGLASSLEEADAWYDAIASAPADYKADVQRKAHDGYNVLASSGTGLEKAKAEKRRDELAAAVAASPERKTGKRVRANDLPEFSNGMVGRVLVNGKDAGVLLTYLPGRPINMTPLNDILQKAKAPGLRVVLEGYISCPVAIDLNVFQSGQSGGPGQIVSIRGNQVSAVGGATGRSSNSASLQLPPGEHLMQWAFDYAGTTTPRINLFDTGSGRPIVIRFTRQQNAAARKPQTTSEENLSF